jgi:SAM-dependent methyltransferase
MAKGFFRGKVLCAAVQLGLPDAFADGERSVDELAAATGTHAPSLHRLLRALASVGVTVETAPGRFVLTALGEPLRRDVSGTVRATVEFWADLMADRWTYLADCIRSGSMAGATQAMKRDGMKSRWEVNPQAAVSLFHGCFAGTTDEDHDRFVDAYDFSGCRVVADLGGGGGALLVSILSAQPGVRGVLVDSEGAIKGAAARMKSAGLSDRCELVVGDLMESVPEGADTYVMKHVLHIFRDDKALRILANCRKVMAPTGRLLVLEHVLPTQVQHADEVVENALMLDMNMLAVTGGGERSEAAWRALLSSGGFELSRIFAAEGTTVRMIEALPVP